MGHECVKGWFRAAVGAAPLPSGDRELASFVRWAQTEHILGQVAGVVDAGQNGRLANIMENAARRSGYDKRMLKFETGRIERALMGQGIQPVLLKGSAYVAEDLLAGIGRRVSDIDILVPEAQIPTVEKLLKQAGWYDEATTANAYDQKYYREWMHELPPLRHATRRTLIDVHHRLLPRTARVQPDHEAMMTDAVSIDGGQLKVFSPLDRFIHSAIHIFADGALETPARSFIELYYLYSDLSENERAKLRARAAQVGASMPVNAACWVLGRYFDVFSSGGKYRISKSLKYSIKALVESGKAAFWSKTFLYIRSHYLRMPLPLLMKHLFRKVLRRA